MHIYRLLFLYTYKRMLLIYNHSMKPLTQKGIIKKHKKNKHDKELHKVIETKEISKKEFGKIIQQSTKQKPFDKKK